MALNQSDRFDDVVNEEGIDYIVEETGEKRKYFYSRSAFWRLIKDLLAEYDEHDEWNQRIVWSNLYKIAPYTTGNPNWSLVKPEMPTYIECILEEIRLYKPKSVLFVTGLDYLAPWESEPTFIDALNIKESKENPYVLGVGHYENSKILVCVRPEKKKTDEMAKIIKAAFED